MPFLRKPLKVFPGPADDKSVGSPHPPDRWTWCGSSAAALVASAFAGPETVYAVGLALVALSVLNVIRGIRRNRPPRPLPWWLAMAALAVFLLGGVVDSIEAAVHRGPVSYPSVADPIIAVSYGLAIASGLVFMKHRTRKADPTCLIDAGIVTAGVAALMWILVLAPGLRNPASSALAKGTDLTFDVMALVLVALVVRLALAPGARNAAWYWLASAIASLLISDLMLTVWSAAQANGWLGILTSELAVWTCVSVAAAALDPSMTRLTETSDAQVPTMAPARLAAMALSVMLVPALVLVRGPGSSLLTTAGVVAAWAGMSTLVLVRMAGLIRARERLARVETVIRRTGSALVTATASAQIYQAACQGACELLEVAGSEGRAAVATLVGSQLVVATGWPVTGDPPVAGATLDSPPLIEALAATKATRLDAAGVAALPDALRAPWVAAFPMVSQQGAQGVLIVGAGRTLPAAVASGCETLARLLALALDGAAAAAVRHQRAAERRFQMLFEYSADVVALLGPPGERGFVSPSAAHILGREPGADPVPDLASAVHPDDRAAYDAVVAGAGAGGGGRGEVRLRAPGGWRWFEVVARDLSAVPEVGSTVVTARDITDRKRAEVVLAESERRFRGLVQHSTDIFATLTDEGMVTWASDALTRLLGWPPGDVVGRPVTSLLEDASRPEMDRALAELGQPGAAGGDVEVSVRATTRSGTVRIFDVTLADARDDSAIGSIVLNARDVTEERTLEAGLRHQALHDDLTGLPNRILLRERVEQALIRAGDESTVALLFVDLDDFKTVNDDFGHAAGDDLLRQAAGRLKASCRSQDTAGRLGGDEFGVLLESAATAGDVVRVCERLREALHAPFDVGGHPLTVTASVGVAVADPPAATSTDELLRRADSAMYVAKHGGKDRVELFQVKEDLRGAANAAGSGFHDHPLIEVAGDPVVGYEDPAEPGSEIRVNAGRGAA
jgi:diguanylate cyclase (GGDEF)-like protein/PAS domain S-box-containing protein